MSGFFNKNEVKQEANAEAFSNKEELVACWEEVRQIGREVGRFLLTSVNVDEVGTHDLSTASIYSRSRKYNERPILTLGDLKKEILNFNEICRNLVCLSN